MEKRQGPKLTVTASCQGCAHERSEYYCVEDGNDCDSGFHVTCAHPAGRDRVGDFTWNTPEWCPLMTAARGALVDVLRDVQ